MKIPNKSEQRFYNILNETIGNVLTIDVRGECTDYYQMKLMELTQKFVNSIVLFYQPFIKLMAKQSYQRSDYSIYVGEKSYCIEIQFSNKLDYNYTKVINQKYYSHEDETILLVDGIGYLDRLDEIKKEMSTHNIQVHTFETIKPFLLSLT